MAAGFKDLASGAVNSVSITTIYTAVAAGVKLQELDLGNDTGADADCTITIGGVFYGKYTVPGNDKVRGNCRRITMNKAVNSGGLVRLTWSVASASLTHHLSGTELG